MVTVSQSVSLTRGVPRPAAAVGWATVARGGVGQAEFAAVSSSSDSEASAAARIPSVTRDLEMGRTGGDVMEVSQIVGRGILFAGAAYLIFGPEVQFEVAAVMVLFLIVMRPKFVRQNNN